MDKKSMLKSLAQSGYNIGFGAKKHLISFDIYRIIPKLISFAILSIGIFQLTSYYKRIFTVDTQDLISVTLIILGIIALITDFASRNLQKYNLAGKELLILFNQLRNLYNELKYSIDPVDMEPYQIKLMEIEEKSKELAISEQVVCTHIITNLAFFGGSMQIDWINEQLNFGIKDKFPFFHFEAVAVYCIIVIIIWLRFFH